MKSKQDRMIELDLMRFIAALAVVLHHLVGGAFSIHYVTKLGYLGVELFFMISGFVILWTAANKTGYEFVVSRISRLYPSFWAALVITTLFVISTGGSISLWQFAANFTMLPSPLGTEYIDIVYWTLLIEAVFYVIIFVLLVSGHLRNIEKWLIGWLLLCAAETLFQLPKAFHHLVLNGYAPFFIIGCLLYLVRTQGLTYRRAGMIVIAFLLGMPQAMRAAVEGYITELGSYVMPAVFIIVATEVLVFFALAMGWWKLPPWKIWAWLGGLTYPLYLSHYRIGTCIGVLLKDRSDLEKLVVSITTALVIAGLLSLTVERYGCPSFNRFLLSLRKKLPFPTAAPSNETA